MAVSRALFSSERQDWETPQALFEALDDEFRFDLDVCATAQNTKCRRFFSPAVDALRQTWRGTCWMNPPYGPKIGCWMRKAFESSLNDFAMRGEIRLVRGRLRFGSGRYTAPFPSAIVVFKPKTYRSFP